MIGRRRSRQDSRLIEHRAKSEPNKDVVFLKKLIYLLIEQFAPLTAKNYKLLYQC